MHTAERGKKKFQPSAEACRSILLPKCKAHICELFGVEAELALRSETAHSVEGGREGRGKAGREERR